METRHGVMIAGLLVTASCASSASPDAVDARPAAGVTDATEATSAPDATMPGDDTAAAETDDSVEPAAWGACTDVPEVMGAPPLECATIDVPVDHAAPSGATIPIALARQPSGDPDARIGSVVFNPGGPGGSGIEFLALVRLIVPEQVSRRFDLVSFDPRGVGASAAIDCDLELDDNVVLIPDDDRSAWDAALASELDDIDTCSSTPEGIEDAVGTMNAARDLDLIRQAIGDDGLTYVGFSYGTRLGAVYADLFPDRVRALVLDGGVAPSTDFEALAAQQAAGFDGAFTSFADACDADADCPLADIGPTRDVLADLRAEIAVAGRFPTDDPGRILTPGELDLGVIASLYSQSSWTYLALAMHESGTTGAGSIFQALADLYLGRQLDGTYTNQVEAGSFINCADDGARPSPDEVWASADATADASEFFGDDLRASFGCLGVPEAIEPLELGPAAGAPPILVVGTTGDPATPYEWSVDLAEFLSSGVLYTVEGEGHTAYTSIDCVAPVVNAYLIDLDVPRDGEGCVDDAGDDAFPPPGESDVELVVAFFGCLRDQGADVDEIGIADVLRDPTGESLLGNLDLTDVELALAMIPCAGLLE